MTWEARSSLVYGSRHQGFFDSEDEARRFADAKIAEHGGLGKITAVVNQVVYYDVYPED